MNTKKERQLDMLHGSIWDKLPRFAFPVAAAAIGMALLIFIALLCYRPSRRFAKTAVNE